MTHTDFDFSQSRVWVTGASRGLGRAIAGEFARAGARVAVTARSSEALEASAGELGDVLVLPGSVSDAASMADAADRIRDEWGGIDVLVNCAGISPSFVRSEDLDPDVWRDVLEVNATGSFICARAAARVMFDQAGGGAIVNVSSIMGQRGMQRLLGYAASKGAVDSLTRTLALEWAERGVRVNSVAPGYFETDMTTGLRESDRWRQVILDRVPMNRFAQPAEVTGAVLFLASDSASFITGATLAVDGGWTAA